MEKKIKIATGAGEISVSVANDRLECRRATTRLSWTEEEVTRDEWQSQSGGEARVTAAGAASQTKTFLERRL